MTGVTTTYYFVCPLLLAQTNCDFCNVRKNKHLMTGPKGNSEFCFPETFNVPRGEAEGNIEVEGKQNSLFPEGPVIKCFVIPCNSNIGKKTAKI